MTTSQIEHYYDVRKAREERGLPVLTEAKVWDRRKGDEHPFLGMRLLDTETDTTYVVDEVTNEWYDGFYVKLVVREEGTNSHGIVLWQNVSCRNSIITELIEEDKQRYKLT